MSSRRALSLFVCPLAPFLIPSSARYTLKQTLRYSWIQTTSRGVASKSRRRKVQIPRGQIESIDKNREVLDQYRASIRSRSLSDVIRLYPGVAEKRFLTVSDASETIGFVLNFYRTTPDALKPKIKPELLAFAESLIEDLKNGRLPSRSDVLVKIISFLKHTEEYEIGEHFWAWVVQQDDEFVSQHVYGAMLELLAFQGRKSLEELEDMYQQALKRCPGTFAAYHLSPEAIVPDRSQYLDLKGLSMTLLQGIITARDCHGDWRGAYLGLDTALRLYPTQCPTRIFELFIYNRPSPGEAYDVFLLACRSGHKLRPEILLAVLNKLAAFTLNRPELSVTTYLGFARAMLNAMRAHVGVGGVINKYHLNKLVAMLSRALPNEDNSGTSDETYNESIASAGYSITKICLEAGIEADITIFNTLIHLGGAAKQPQLSLTAVQDIADLQLEPTKITYRTLLLAAGYNCKPKAIEQSWRTLVEASEAQRQALDVTDWKALATACRKADHREFIQDQKQQQSHTMTDAIKREIARELGRSDRTVSPKLAGDDPAKIKALTEDLVDRAAGIAEMMKTRLSSDFYNHPIPMTLDLGFSLGREEDLRAIYDELTTDPQQVASVRTGPKPTSTTGFPLDELRFRNWLSVNNLLAQAEATQEERHVPDGTAPDEVGTPDEGDRTARLDALRRRILRLRGRK
ncbi:hypothetical protein M501DRAFT_475581 [Patellaria atrata CBS 101060]|uniref:Pentatricopeptide repeat protein n=1 Tax=Patellaria atrata CBS 101060 TaxID=1346257 RepID=A0A9P4S2C5_9PEZI|nr:hypothetical protein M501DRAFT_475581 [Patellaria atrata CBS 101060]